MVGRRPLPGLLCAALIPALAAPATADTLVLTSGRTKEGVIVEETDTMIKLETAAGVMGIPLTMIESVTRVSDDENAELRRRWALEQRQEEREQAQRRAARRAREQAEAASTQGTVEMDGERVTHIEGARRLEQERREAEMERRTVEAFKREQQKLPEEQQAEGPLVFRGISTRQQDAGLLVVAQIYNISTEAQRGVQVSVELLEEAGKPDERLAAQQVVIIDHLPPSRIYDLAAQFPVSVARPLTPRLTLR